MSHLFEHLVARECTAYVRRLIEDALADLTRARSHFELNRFELTIEHAENLVLVRSNPEILGTECPDDISDTWYIVARGGPEEAISIDCSRDRLGRCYDSFWDRQLWSVPVVSSPRRSPSCCGARTIAAAAIGIGLPATGQATRRLW
jgi:hypothetical protein